MKRREGEEPWIQTRGVEFCCGILPGSSRLSLWAGAAQSHLLQPHLLLPRTSKESLGQSCGKTCRGKAAMHLLLESQQFSFLVPLKTITLCTKKYHNWLREFWMFGQHSQEKDDRHALRLDSRQSAVTSQHSRTVRQGSPAQMQGTTQWRIWVHDCLVPAIVRLWGARRDKIWEREKHCTQAVGIGSYFAQITFENILIP